MYLLILILSWVVLAEPLGQWFVFEGSSDAILHLDLSEGVRRWHQLHHTWTTHDNSNTTLLFNLCCTVEDVQDLLLYKRMNSNSAFFFATTTIIHLTQRIKTDLWLEHFVLSRKKEWKEDLIGCNCCVRDSEEIHV